METNVQFLNSLIRTIHHCIDLGVFENANEASSILDEVFKTLDPRYQGHLCLQINGQALFIDQFAINWSKGYWFLVAFGVFKPSDDGTKLTPDYAKYHVSYRFRNELNPEGLWKDYIDNTLFNGIKNLQDALTEVKKNIITSIDGKPIKIENGNITLKLEKKELFDYTKGNDGAFTINKKPEDITLLDVEQAYTVPLPYGFRSIDEIPIGKQKVGTKYLAKASEISVVIGGKTKKLQTNMNDAEFGLATYGTDNKTILEEVFKDEDCIGLYIDKGLVYPLNCKYGSKVSGKKANSLVLPRDFIITGTNNNSTKGGLYAKGGMLYSENSIVLHKVRIINKANNGSASVFITTEKGVDLFQALNCEFISYGTESGRVEGGNAQIYPAGCFITIYTPSFRPYKLKEGETIQLAAQDYTSLTRELENTACINHLYMSGCVSNGGKVLVAPSARFVKSCRIINNKFNRITNMALNLSCLNEENDSCLKIDGTEGWEKFASGSNITYSSTKIFMSCPIYIVGNTFEGLDKIVKDYDDKGQYYTPVVGEARAMYVLHNTISNFISGIFWRKDRINQIETYDSYLSCLQAYFCNNTVKNIVRFKYTDTMGGGYGICKGKNTNAFHRGGSQTIDLVRYYMKNNYSIEPDKLRLMWNDYYNSSSKDTEDEIVKEEELVNTLVNTDSFNRIIAVNIAAESVVGARTCYSNETNHPILKEFVFSDNIIDAGDGCISGTRISGVWPSTKNSSGQVVTVLGLIKPHDSSSDWPTNKLSICNNVFRAKYFENQGKIPTENRNSSWYMFHVRLCKRPPEYGNTILEIKDNSFIINSDKEVNNKYGICFVTNGYTTEDLRRNINVALTAPLAFYNAEKVLNELTSDRNGDISIIQDNKVVSSLNTPPLPYITCHKTNNSLSYLLIDVIDKVFK